MASRTSIETALRIKRTRLEAYIKKEADILAGGVQSYGIGSRNLARYNADLATVRTAISELESEIESLESQLAGRGRRHSAGVVVRDW